MAMSPHTDKKSRPEAGTPCNIRMVLTRTRDAADPGFRCPLRCSGSGRPFSADRIGLVAGHSDRTDFSGLAGRIDCLAARIVRPAGGFVPYHLPCEVLLFACPTGRT